MTGRLIVAILLIVVGLVGLAYGELSFTHKKDVVDLGAVEITRNQRETLPVPPIVGGVLVIAGIALLFVRGRASA